MIFDLLLSNLSPLSTKETQMVSKASTGHRHVKYCETKDDGSFEPRSGRINSFSPIHRDYMQTREFDLQELPVVTPPSKEPVFEVSQLSEILNEFHSILNLPSINALASNNATFCNISPANITMRMQAESTHVIEPTSQAHDKRNSSTCNVNDSADGCQNQSRSSIEPDHYNVDTCEIEMSNNQYIEQKQEAESKVNRGSMRLNKFVRRLHDMLLLEQGSGIVEWRKGLLLLHSTSDFTKTLLPKYFNTRNFKTFRRQLNYYGFVHVRSLMQASGSMTSALWLNQELAKHGCVGVSSVLMLRRVEPSESFKTVEGRRQRKEAAASTVENLGAIACTVESSNIVASVDMPNNENAMVPIENVKHLVSDVQLELNAMTSPDYYDSIFRIISNETNISVSVETTCRLAEQQVHDKQVTSIPHTFSWDSMFRTPTSQLVTHNKDLSTGEAANLLMMLSSSIVPVSNSNVNRNAIANGR